jgi:hypothetical protein
VATRANVAFSIGWGYEHIFAFGVVARTFPFVDYYRRHDE